MRQNKQYSKAVLIKEMNHMNHMNNYDNAYTIITYSHTIQQQSYQTMPQIHT